MSIPPTVAVTLIASAPVPEPLVRAIFWEAASPLVKTRLFLSVAFVLSSVIV